VDPHGAHPFCRGDIAAGRAGGFEEQRHRRI
jgi:hypothetical protein